MQKHYNSIINNCGKTILSDHYRRIARIYEETNNFSCVKQFYYKAFISAPWYWKNILYIILLSFGKSIGLTFGGNLKLIGEAALEARQLGINLAQVDKIAEGIDFSQSEVQENKVIEESVLTLLKLFTIELKE